MTWRPIPFAPDYEASSDGEIRSGGRWKNGSITMRPCTNKQGYSCLILRLPNGKRQSFFVHRLVMAAHVGDRIYHVNHKNGDLLDNRLSNLEYIAEQAMPPRSEQRGERNPCARLKTKDVARIRRLYASRSMTQSAIAQEYGVNQSHISRIVRGITWTPIFNEP